MRYKTFSPVFRLSLLLLLTLLTACGSRRIIVNNLDEKEANEIIVYLSNKGIDATKVPAPAAEGGAGGKAALWNISVDETQGNEAMALLNQVGLPRRKGQNLLGIFGNTSLVPSGLQEKIRYQAGLAEQIASTIRKIDGVLDADVQISFPEEDPLNPNANKQKITASVYVKHNGVLDDPNAHLITRIKRLVAGSINGLDYDNVTVIGDKARYGDIGLSGQQGNLGEEEKHYVTVWGVVLAHESVTRFQILFFSLSFAILLLLLSLIWLLWKLLPILKAAGGFKKLLSYHPLHVEDLAAKTAAPPAEKNPPPPPSETSKKPEEEVEKGVDET